MTPTKAATTPTTAISDAPVGRCTGRSRRVPCASAAGASMDAQSLHHEPTDAGADGDLTAISTTSAARADDAPAMAAGIGAAAPARVRGERHRRSSPASPSSPLGMLVVRDGTVSGVEEAWFRAVNDLPELALPGRLAVAAARCAAARSGRRRSSPSSCAGTAWPSPPASSPLLKLRHASGPSRPPSAAQRPGTSIGPDVELRGDVHLDRRELRLRARRARGRPGRRRHAVPARALEGRAVGPRRRGDGRAGLRRRPQPARRRLRCRPRHRHRRRRQPGRSAVRPAPPRRAGVRRASTPAVAVSPGRSRRACVVAARRAPVRARRPTTSAARPTT